MSMQTQAAIVSGPDIIAAVSVQEDSPTNTAQQGFNEKQGVILTSDIAVDGGTIAKGMKVDSHLIFLNTKTGSAYDRQKWVFSGTILGVMSQQNGNMLMNSNSQLAAFNNYFAIPGLGTLGPFSAQGLEQMNLEAINQDGYAVSGNMLDLAMYVKEPGDWVRVVTVSEVPVPAALWLFAPALAGLVGLRRKSKTA